MIQLYIPSNTNYINNGDVVIRPISCYASFELNGSWELELETPLDDNSYLITENAVICVNTPFGKKQLYRIYYLSKNEMTITANARPIAFDAKNDCFLFDIRPTNKNGQEALLLMTQSNSKYKVYSDIKKVSTAYYIHKNFIEALCSNDENSFLNRWGGEIAYKNYDFIVNETLGSDMNVRVEFGFNLNGIEEEIDMSDVVTRIIPKSFNGYTLPKQETVDSPLINKYPIVFEKVVEYTNIKLKEDAQESDKTNGSIICDNLEELYSELRKASKIDFENGIDLPTITYSVGMIDLSKTELYKNYTDLLKINLGDTVHIKHRRLNITTKSRVVNLKYDCIREVVTDITLGDFQNNYFNESSSVINSVSKVIDQSSNSLVADKIKGVINLMQTSLKAQKDIAKRQDVRAILFEDLDKTSPTFGAMCLGTRGIQIAQERNSSNTDWKWGVAIDFQTIYANYIVTGLLSDKKGNNSWNLDSGDLISRKGTFVDAQIENATIINAYITGVLNSVTMNGGKIYGTTIETEKDMKIGANLYFGDEGFQGMKRIIFNNLGNTYDTISAQKSGGIGIGSNDFIFFESNDITSSVPIVVSSDKRLKQNFENIDLSRIIDIMQIKKFNYIGNSNKTVGIIANDFVGTEYEDVILRKDDKGFYSIDYNVVLMAIAQYVKKERRRND